MTIAGMIRLTQRTRLGYVLMQVPTNPITTKRKNHTLELIHVTLGPGQMIKYVIGYDKVKNGKPAPDLFLHAADELLGAEPSRCLVFEDAEPGFLAATAAGMTYIDVRPSRTDLSAAAVYKV